MYIESFRIDGFGIYNGVTVPQLPPGMSIFLGENEAGKSTCLEFLRTMLTGYPTGRRALRDTSPLRGGQAGGGLVLRPADRERLVLTRRPGTGDGVLSLHEEGGEMVDAAVLQQLLSHISREVYCAVFGFSLLELETVSSLNAEDVRNALYSASFGAGLRSPGEAMALIDARMDSLFRKRSGKAAINAALTELNGRQEEITRLSAEYASYDTLAESLSAKRQALAALREEKSELETERRDLERRLNVWQMWDGWRATGLSLEHLPDTDAGFPEDGRERLARLQEAREACERDLALHEEKLRGIRVRRDALVPDAGLIDALAVLQRLAERKSSYRQAVLQRPVQMEECRRLEAQLTGDLTRLGPGWDCDRIRATDRSLFARTDMERQAREMTAADSTHKAAVNTLSQASADVARAENDAAEAERALAALPTPTAMLDDEERDELRQMLTRFDEARRRMPERDRACEAAHTAFMRSWDPLRMASGAASDDPEGVLDKLLQGQDEALAMAGEVRDAMREAEDAAQAVQQMQERIDDVKDRMERLRQSRKEEAPSREMLEARTRALRQLRSTAAALEKENERSADLKARLDNAPAPAKNGVPSLLILGALLGCLGVAVLAAHLLSGMTAFPLTDTLAVPVNLWFGYVVLVAGVAFAAAGMPRSDPAAKRQMEERRRLESSLDTCAQRIGELGSQASRLRIEARVDSMDEITLEATEVMLEREREICYLEERAQADMETLRQEMARARTQLAEAQAKAHEKEGAVQQVRRRWHEYMLALHVANVPSPEAAQAFFARAESARMAFAALTAVRADRERLAGDMESLAGRMRALPAVAEHLPDEGRDDEKELTDSVRRVLESCREADLAREDRLQAEAALAGRRDELERARRRQEEAARALSQAEERRDAAFAAWRTCLESFGLDTALDPETVRQALRFMDDCLARENELTRAREALARTAEEAEGFERPIAALVQSLGRAPALHSDGSEDWLTTLDETYAAARAETRIRDDRARADALADEEMVEVNAASAALEAARANESALLEQADASDADDFLARARVWEQRQDLLRRRQALEDNLRLAAGDGAFEDFLRSFEDEDQAAQEKRHDAVTARLEELVAEEDALAAEVAELGAKVAGLTGRDTLAESRQAYAENLADLEALAREWSRLALARTLLDEARREFERDRQPAIIRDASEIFARITDGRWRGIGASLEEKNLYALPADGRDPVDPAALSRGTCEQAYLALRLAYIRSHAAHAETLPIIMDEVLVNFDQARAERTAREFARMTAGGAGRSHQIFYFTCHPGTVETLRGAQPDAAVFSVKDGHILPA